MYSASADTGSLLSGFLSYFRSAALPFHYFLEEDDGTPERHLLLAGRV